MPRKGDRIVATKISDIQFGVAICLEPKIDFIPSGWATYNIWLGNDDAPSFCVSGDPYEPNGITKVLVLQPQSGKVLQRPRWQQKRLGG